MKSVFKFAGPALITACLLAACGGGGGSSSATNTSSAGDGSFGTVPAITAIRATPVPSGALQIANAADANQQARIANTAHTMAEIVAAIGFVNFSSYVENFEDLPVGSFTSSSSTNCAGGGTVALAYTKASNADISFGDTVSFTYNSCVTNGFRFSGTISTRVIGFNASNNEFALTYGASSFASVELAPNHNFGGINATITNIFQTNSRTDQYTINTLTGSYGTTVASERYEVSSYTVTNMVRNLDGNNGDVAFAFDVAFGVSPIIMLKVDTTIPVFSPDSGLVQILRTGYGSKTLVDFVGGDTRVRGDAANDGTFEFSTQLAVDMF
jgi:hypothetical protein